jgi:hypothetical protein
MSTHTDPILPVLNPKWEFQVGGPSGASSVEPLRAASAVRRRLEAFKAGTGIYSGHYLPPSQPARPPQLVSRARELAIAQAEARGDRLLIVALPCPESRCLHDAIRRCYDPSNPGYRNYGGRGIAVCDEWRDRWVGVYRFLAHVGLKPDPRLSIDRIDNDRGYEPGNVRWADLATQLANRRPRRSRATS